MSRTAFGPTEPLVLWVATVLFLSVRQPRCEYDHSLPPSAEVKNESSCNSTHLICQGTGKILPFIFYLQIRSSTAAAAATLLLLLPLRPPPPPPPTTTPPTTPTPSTTTTFYPHITNLLSTSSESHVFHILSNLTTCFAPCILFTSSFFVCRDILPLLQTCYV
jgi:hypothetical protein